METKTFRLVQVAVVFLNSGFLVGCQPSSDGYSLPYSLLCGIAIFSVMGVFAIRWLISSIYKSNKSTAKPIVQVPVHQNTERDLPNPKPVLVSDFVDDERDITLSTEDVPLDNRHGSSPISSEHEFSQTAKISVSLVKNQEVSAGVNATVWSVFEADLNAKIAKNLGVEIGQEIHRRVTVKFEALPGKFVRYRVVWKQNVRRGNFEVAIGSKTIKVPYEAIYGLFHSIESISDD